MQTRGWLVEDVERASGVALGEFQRKLDALRLASGQRGRRLAEADVTQADVDQRGELFLHHRHRVEEHGGVLHRHLQHVADGLALVVHLQRLAVVARAVADVARHVDIRQEVHLDLDHAIALAGLAAPALDVEGKAPRAVAARARFRYAGEEFADRCEKPRIRGRVGARRASDRALVDVDHLVEEFQAVDFSVRRRLGGGAVQVARDRRIQGVVDERRLARARYAGDAHHQSQRQVEGDVLQVVAVRIGEDQPAFIVHAAARLRDGDSAVAGEVLAGE